MCIGSNIRISTSNAELHEFGVRRFRNGAGDDVYYSVPMVARPLLSLVSWLLLMGMVAGCDRAPSSSAPGVALPGKPIADLTPLTQLDANRTVHVAVDALGNVFYSVETDNGADGAIVVGD